MKDLDASFLSRFSLAVGTFFSILGDRELAAGVRRLRDGESGPDLSGVRDVPGKNVPAATTVTAAPPASSAPTPAAAPRPLKEAGPEAALQLLGLLQRDARFIDFVEEDITGYANAEIGAAARLVHDGCRTTLREHFTIRPVRTEAEGTRVSVPDGFDATAIRLTGNVVGHAPFSGNLSHRGWRVEQVRLPKLTESHDATVIAPAEVEL
jgi:hypothetical protein